MASLNLFFSSFPPGNVLADSIDNAITEDSLASLIRMPGGCVEQNLASITLPLIATLYLERTEGWESVGVQRKAEALRYIRRGETLLRGIQSNGETSSGSQPASDAFRLREPAGLQKE